MFTESVRCSARRWGIVAAALLAACDASTVLPESRPCERCHGGDGSAAPPRSVKGLVSTSDRPVGAHRKHLTRGAIRDAIRCDECHVVPARIEGHFRDEAATVTFGALARNAGASPAWAPGTLTCSGVYCHGATLWADGSATAPVWTLVDGTQAACGACHGYPPTKPGHPQGAFAAGCHGCHGDTVLADHVTIDVDGGRHVNGKVDVAGGSCGGCHGAPPASGAHAAHANPPSEDDVAYGDLHVLEDVATSGARYDFGCGHCHPIDLDRHANGVVDVELAPDGAAAGSLKARNAADAAFEKATGTCSGAYCHSSGQESPAYVEAPAWSSAPGTLGCGGCHGNPPRYASGGEGAVDANSHLALMEDAPGEWWEWGHFGGLPGPWHNGSKHGGRSGPGQSAAPITCQTCHADTVDPTSTGPSGFYWLDTKGDYDLGGLLGFACEGCHTGNAAEPARGAGKVLPLRHVNGRREVVFDVRTELPVISWLPAAPNTATRPYWATDAALGGLPDPAVPGATVDGSTLSVHLSGARYDPATKTCSSVGCHLWQTSVTWGGDYGFMACAGCHGWL